MIAGARLTCTCNTSPGRASHDMNSYRKRSQEGKGARTTEGARWPPPCRRTPLIHGALPLHPGAPRSHLQFSVPVLPVAQMRDLPVPTVQADYLLLLQIAQTITARELWPEITMID